MNQCRPSVGVVLKYISSSPSLLLKAFVEMLIIPHFVCWLPFLAALPILFQVQLLKISYLLLEPDCSQI